MTADPARWLRALPPELATQRDLIAALLERARSEERIRLFVVGCSIGRGAADRLSDVDALIGVRPDAWADTLAASRAWVEAAGDALDLHQQLIREAVFEGGESQHTFAQYRSGAQLDLAIARVRETQQPRADWVVLYDPDHRVVSEVKTSATTADDVRRWTFAALTRLSAASKYLVRGSLWEAQLMVELARADVWRLWATAERVADPQYGLTAVLDDPRRPLPPGIDRTAAPLERDALASAALVCCDLLIEAWPRAIAAVGDRDGPLPPFAAYVRDELRALRNR